MKLINRNLLSKIEIKEIISENRHRKMPVFNCQCGMKILLVPDLTEMDKAIKSHLVEHKRLTGSSLTEESLTQEILKVLMNDLNEAWLAK